MYVKNYMYLYVFIFVKFEDATFFIWSKDYGCIGWKIHLENLHCVKESILNQAEKHSNLM